MNPRPKKLILLILSSCMIWLSSCGGDASSSSTVVSGYVSKGPLTGATCQLYNGSNQAVGTLGTATAGVFDLGSTAQTGPMSVSCTGGTYSDEATGTTTALTGTMRGAVILSGGKASLVISPLTEIVMQRAGGNPANAAEQAPIVAKALGLDGVDILSTLPTDLNTAAATANPQGRYGTVLAGVAQMMKDESQTLEQLVSTLASTIKTDGALRADTSAVFQNALSNLTNPAKNTNAQVQSNTQAAITQSITSAATTNTDNTPFVKSLALTTPVTTPTPSASAYAGVTVKKAKTQPNPVASMAIGAEVQTVTTPIWGQAYTAVATGGNLSAATFSTSGMRCDSASVTNDGKTMSAQCVMNNNGATAKITVEKTGIVGSQASAIFYFSNGSQTCDKGTPVFGSISPSTVNYAEQGKIFTVSGCNLSTTDTATLGGISSSPESGATETQVRYKWNITNNRSGATGSLVAQGKTQAISYTPPTITLTAISPSTAIKGATGNAGLTLTGQGLYAGMPVTLMNANNVATTCTGAGQANAIATELTNVNCSNVSFSQVETSAILNVAGNAGNALSISLQDPPSSSLTLSLDQSSIQMGGTGAMAKTLSNNSQGAIVFTSSDTSVATVNASTGAVTAINSGTARITATQAAVIGQYAQTTQSVNLTVTTRTVPTLEFAQNSKVVTLGAADFDNLITTKSCTTETNYNPTVAYNIASGGSYINLDAGRISLKGAGNATVQASVPQVGTCAAQLVSYNITINKATPTLSFNSSSVTATYGGAAISNNPAVPSAPANLGIVPLPSITNLALSYSSSNTAVATVSTTGVVTPLTPGSTTISATLADDANYNAISSGVSYQLSVTKALPTLSVASTLSLYLLDDAQGKSNAATLTGGGSAAPTGSIGYASSNTAVATVNSVGLVVPVSAGTATITASYTGDANYLAADQTTIVTVSAGAVPSLVKACSGANCGATSDVAYSGNGIGVWRLDNTTANAITTTISIDNVTADKEITLAFTNGASTAASSTPGAGLQASAMLLPPLLTKPLFAQNLAKSHRMRHSDAHTEMLIRNQLEQEKVQSSNLNAQGQPPLRNIAPLFSTPAVGATRNWAEYQGNATYTSTAKSICTLNNGRNFVFWRSNTDTVLSDPLLRSFSNALCGTPKGGDKLIGLIGDVWGAHSQPTVYISDDTQKQDIHVVFVDAPNQGWAGYFWARNNLLTTASTPSNEALVFFVNTTNILDDIPFHISTLIHELAHMITFYQNHMVRGKTSATWFQETHAMMSEDIVSTGLLNQNMMETFRIPNYMASGGAFSLSRWGVGDNYGMGGAFGAFLNRRYGTNLLTQSVTQCDTGLAKTDSYSCVDGLIKAAGGRGLADELARMGSSIYAKLPAVGVPTGFGYPEIVSNNFTLSGIDTTANGLADPQVLTSYTAMTQTYLRETQSTGKTRYIRQNVTVPANTTLYLVIK